MFQKLKRKVWIGAVLAAAIFSVNVYAATCAVYTVEKGDCLWAISENYQVDLQEVISYNPQIENPDLIYPGDKVYVPVEVVEREKTERPGNQNADDNSNNNSSGNNDDTTPVPSGNTDDTPAESETSTQPDTDNHTGGNNNDGNNDNNSNDNSESSSEEPAQSEDAGPSDDLSQLSDLEAEVFQLVNEERAKAGLSALTLNTDVTEVARIKSKDMIDQKYFDHYSPTYGSPSQMLTTFSIRYNASGENIAYGQQSAQEVMNTWMNSAGHKANILGSQFTQIGIGCVAMSNGTLYWTQLFIG